ncbi:LysR family transcriptional regulator [Azospirillum endophyticum]
MELRHLRYFIAVAEHESVRLAAKRVNITQPAISRQIQYLEEELGVALFDRGPRGLRLTAAGALYLAEARKVLTLLEAAGRSARLVAAGQEGQLRIGFVENAGWDGLVPELFSRFQREAPGVRVELAPLNTPAQLEELTDGRLDGGFVYLFGPAPAGLHVRPLLEHDVVLAVPCAWNLPTDAPVHARDLAGRPFITFPRHTYPAYYDRLIGACQQAGLTLNVVQEVSTEAAILSLVSAGIGAAIVNSANRGRPPALARFIELADLSIPLPLAFACLDAAHNPALDRFLRVIDSAS